MPPRSGARLRPDRARQGLMCPGPTFDRVYLALKDQLMAGRYAPGDHLEPVAIGDELHSSITPVRDALHRLVGERLVEAPRNDGFRSPLLTEFALRHLYGLSADLLLLALKAPQLGRLGEELQTMAESGRDDRPDPAGSLFRAIGALSANPEHRDAIVAACARLGAANMVEPLVLDSGSAELDAMQAALHRQDLRGLRRLILAYHRRRARAAPLILESMHRRQLPE